MRYWWVNHKQTVRQEIDDGYLWSPKREKAARSQFYDNMRLAAPGDLVLSYANGVIGYWGMVTDFATTAPKPTSFGKTGENWGAEGWILPVEWRPLAVPIRPKSLIASLAPLLPNKYSPIHPVSGDGNQKAYLAEISRAVVELLLHDVPHPDASDNDGIGARLLSRVDDVLETIIDSDGTLDATVKRQLVLARHGQGLFRARIFGYEAGCRLTGVTNPRLLVASHVKPWRVCGTAKERLDGANGLILTPSVDRLFDRGLVTFGDDGTVLRSSRLDTNDIDRLGLGVAFARSCGTFAEAQRPYLAYHRAEVFLV